MRCTNTGAALWDEAGMTTIALAGATGLVGRAVLELALADDRVTRIVAPTRKPLPPHPKLDTRLVEFTALPSQAEWWAVDAGICALGTTRTQAGSRAAFRRTDHGYPLAFAHCLRSHGAERFALISAAGASTRSPILYFRVKGELERDLANLGFASLTLIRPELIVGEREVERRSERTAVGLLATLRPILPTLVQINPATVIARAALEAALIGTFGREIIGPDRLTR